jgi:hypothetical protein
MENVIVYGAFFGAMLLLFPIFLSVDVYLDVKQGKLFCVFRLFGKITAFGGYVTLEKKGIFLHVSPEKALFFPFAEMKSKRFEMTAGFQTYVLKTTIEIGYADHPLAALSFASFLQAVTAAIVPVVKSKKGYITVKNTVFLSEGVRGVRLTTHYVTVFNQLTVLIAAVKFILEEIIQLWQAKKNTRPLKT